MRTPVLNRMRPEVAAGGYSRNDSTTLFYQRINALLTPEMVILDLGAGRGAFLDKPDSLNRRLRMMKGKVAEVVGLDVDPAVHTNVSLDRADIMEINAPFPLADNSVDLIFSDWVLEHIDYPENFVAEVDRVLKPGGWFCARTPSKWSMTAFGARLVPNRLHATVLSKAQPTRKEIDVFPTRYRMNTLGDLKRLFNPRKWVHASFGWAGDPAYHFENPVLWWFMNGVCQLLPQGFANNLLIFIQKRATPEA